MLVGSYVDSRLRASRGSRLRASESVNQDIIEVSLWRGTVAQRRSGFCAANVLLGAVGGGVRAFVDYIRFACGGVCQLDAGANRWT